MPLVRVLADDLTGALDTAARFLPLTGPLPVFWKPPQKLAGSAAIDAGTRELTEGDARAMTDRLSVLLQDAELPFKKIDSLLRGHPASEIASCVRRFDHCVIAPAFPFQGRITRRGRQMKSLENEWRDAGVDLPAELSRLGFPCTLCQPGDLAPSGISFWDAETEGDLLAIIDAGQGLEGRVLWCGTGGLAGAIADGFAPPPPPLPRPILALIGSDHPTTIGQLSAAWAHVHRIRSGGADEAAPIARRLTLASAAAVAIIVPPGVGREEGRRHIERCFAALLEQLDPPGSLLISGGETLRMVCDLLGAAYLEVDGEILPGVPTSVLRGGRWDGISVISKSGAFGNAGLLLRLLGDER